MNDKDVELLKQYKELLEKNIITQEEFDKMKEKILDGQAVENDLAKEKQEEKRENNHETKKKNTRDKKGSGKVVFIIAAVVIIGVIIGIFAGGGSSNSFDDENAVIYSYENIGDVIYEDDDTNAKLMSIDISNINTTDKSLKINLLVKTKSGEFPSGLIMTNCLMCNEEDSVATSATVSGTENEKSGWDIVIDFATPDKLFGTDIKEAKGNLSFGGDAVPTVFKLSGSEKLAKSVISISKIWVEPGAYSFSKPRLYLNFTNKSDKTIKYLDFETKYYNKVGDEVQEGDYENINIINSYRHEGPIKKGEGLSGSYWGWDVDVKDAKTVELSGLVIEYMDGTILHFDDKMLEAVK